MDPNKAHMFKPSLNYNGTAASVRIQLKLIVCALSPSNIISCQTKQQWLATMAPFGTTPSGSGSAVHNTVAPLFIEAASLPPFPPLSPTSPLFNEATRAQFGWLHRLRAIVPAPEPKRSLYIPLKYGIIYNCISLMGLLWKWNDRKYMHSSCFIA